MIERHPAVGALRDSYVLEFLDVPEDSKEKDLRKAIIANLKKFILEFGKDFTFVGEEYRVQVGNTDFFIDLLFFNRALSRNDKVSGLYEKLFEDHAENKVSEEWFMHMSQKYET